MRDQLTEAKDTIIRLEETIVESSDAITKLSQTVTRLSKEIETSRNSKAPPENMAIKKMNEALSIALKAVGSSTGIQKSTLDSKRGEDSIIIDEEEEVTSKKSSKIKLKINTTLPSFSGLPHQNINEFIHGSDRIFECGEYTDTEKVNAASSYLKGVAFSDWLLHEQEYGKQTWKQFCDYMKKKYTPTNHSQVIRSRIRNLKQITSVKDYFIDFRALCIQAQEMNADEKLDYFISTT